VKIVWLMYLEDDDDVARRLLHEAGIGAYSVLPLEGHGSGAAGWLGEVPAYRSRMAFAVVPPDAADRLMEAVAACGGCADPSHPIHAMQVDVEKSIESPATFVGDTRS